MQKIVLFIEPSSFAFRTPVKIGNLFMNQFAIDEDDSSEILNIFELDKIESLFKMSGAERKQKGMDQILKILH